jgi:cell division protease FtsH
LLTRSQFKDALAVALAGHTAEQMVFGEMSTGASDDIDRATKLARKMVTGYGMSDKLGPRTFGRKEELVFLGKEITEQKDYSEKVAQEIDEEVQAIIEEAHRVARDILTRERAKLVQIAQRLMTDETIESEDLKKLFDEPAPSDSVEPEAEQGQVD